MPAVFTKSARGVDTLGRRQFHPGKLALDNSYPTGGYSVTLAGIKARNARAIESCIITGGNPAANPYKFTWDSTNNKVMGAWSGPAINGVLAEIANATNLAAVTLDVIFILV